MRYRLWIMGLLVLVSCSDSKFSGGQPSGAAADAIPETDPNPKAPEGDNTGCAPENIVKSAFPTEVAQCYESGRVWNFGSSQCVQMRAAEFECNWENVSSELKKIGLHSSAVDEAGANPLARLVGCGQSQDKMRIVVQWITLPRADASCGEVKGSGAVTGCFTNYGSTTPPAPPANQAEQDKRTYECMNL